MAPEVAGVRRRATFRALARADGRATRGPVTVLYSAARANTGLCEVAYAVGRRHGAAVVRNRLRRRLREAVRAAAPELAPGAYLVRPEASAGEAPFPELCEAVRAAAIAAGRAGAAPARSGATGAGSASA
jgi:ribonuclease P protein component